MKEAFVGFDSAWAGNRQGAIAYAVFQENDVETAPPPHLADFADAARIIKNLQGECRAVLIAIDQPIIVPNCTTSRPVDRVAGSLMRQLGSAAQPANQCGKPSLFGDGAPVWKFINRIKPPGMTSKDFKDFEAAKIATGTTRLIETYPALALPALNSVLWDRKSVARYNPDKKDKFCPNDWRLVCKTVERCADVINLQPLSQWASEMVNPWDSPEKPKKPHQDKIDAALCLIIAFQWRQQSNGVRAIGNLDKGYIVVPTSRETRRILREAAHKNEVPISPKH